MKKFTLLLSAMLLALATNLWAEEVTYTVASTSSVTATGDVYDGSSATFSQTYSTKEQLTKGNSMTLTLKGYTGCTITGITLNMKSNKSAGTGTFSAKAGTTTLAEISSATEFSSWFDNTAYTTTYKDVHVTMSNDTYAIQAGENVVINIAATVNSLYCHSFTLTYKLNGGTPCEGYTITVDNEIANGSISANVATACEGETVTLTAEPAEGYALAEWLVFDDANNTIEVTDNKFTMPAANVTVMAEFAEVPKYTVAWNVNGETYTTGEPTTTVIAGEKVTVLPTAPANNTLSCSNVFAGWSTTNIRSKAGETQPEDLYTSAATAPAVTENTTYYAVFATADGEVKTYLNETFDKTDGTGGNDDQWTGSIATSKVTTDNDGWSLENQGGANKCVKLGGGSKLGKATTPALGLSGSAVLTFRAGAWQNDKEQTTLKVSISVGSLSAETVTLEKGKFNNYSIDITNGTARSTITFAGAQASKSRFFLDDVVVKTNATMKDYRTNCDGISTEIENATVAEKAVKMIENGQLVIIREGVKYNAQGVRL